MKKGKGYGLQAIQGKLGESLGKVDEKTNTTHDWMVISDDPDRLADVGVDEEGRIYFDGGETRTPVTLDLVECVKFQINDCYPGYYRICLQEGDYLEAEFNDYVQFANWSIKAGSIKKDVKAPELYDELCKAFDSKGSAE